MKIEGLRGLTDYEIDYLKFLKRKQIRKTHWVNREYDYSEFNLS